MTAPIGLFYGSSTCYTEMIAERIQQLLGPDRVDLHSIANNGLDALPHYRYLIFGIPTWDYGELQEDWDQCWDMLSSMNLHGCTAAVFGLGDQVGYGEWFQDALGYLALQLQACGASLVGAWPNLGYEFISSKGLTPDGQYFYGLALDQENQAELTEKRLITWLKSLPIPAIDRDRLG